MDCRNLQTVTWWKSGMEREFKNRPLSESSVSHKLTEIQERCSRLSQESDWLDELTLEGETPVKTSNSNRHDPYNHG